LPTPFVNAVARHCAPPLDAAAWVAVCEIAALAAIVGWRLAITPGHLSVEQCAAADPC
jgi:hypothetical protein